MSTLRFENTANTSRGTPGDLGLPVHNRLPANSEPVSELGTQQRLIQPAQHPLLTLQVAGVQGVPRSVVGLDLGRDYGVGVMIDGIAHVPADAINE
jgi:hypothetical protein